MARRAGQIVPRGERKWLVRWFVGTSESGKRRYASKTIRGTKRDAQQHLNSVLRSQDLGTYVEPTRIALDAYLDRWLEQSARTRVSPRTFEDYKKLLKRYVRPEIGPRRLDALRPLHLQELITKLEARGLSPKTIRLTLSVLSRALKQAVRWGMLPNNPAALIDLPKQRRREMRALSQEEVARFRTAAAGTRHAVLFDFLLATGCRPGEALALRWSDIDLDVGAITVRRALTTVAGKPTFGEPKTATSHRRIPLPTQLCDSLSAHRREQAEGALKTGPAYSRNLDLVFANEVGRPLELRNIVRRHFKPLLELAGLPPSVRLYDLRHTHATLLLAQGVHPKVAAERLGHATTRMTLDVYSHVLPGMQAEATVKIANALFSDR